MDFGQVYFWTNTIRNWKRLLGPDKYKQIIIDCWCELARRDTIVVYAFVIMPNHIHAVWEMRDVNGKETPLASFNKFTSHQFLADLKAYHPQVLAFFRVNEGKRQHQFWQRDPLAVLMDSSQKVLQKIDYIHNNPLQEHWNLAIRPEEYYWSSAQFYKTGDRTFSFLTHYKERFE
ncbi:transposase [Spirosoma humi]